MERGEERKKQRKERESVIEEMYEMVWGGEEIIKLQVGKGGNGRSECKGVFFFLSITSVMNALLTSTQLHCTESIFPLITAVIVMRFEDCSGHHQNHMKDYIRTTATVQWFRVSSPVKYIDILQHMLPTFSANARGSVSFIIRQKVSGWWMMGVVVRR